MNWMKLTFAAIGPGELTPPATHQGGDIILLEAKVRYGKISYEDGDVLQRERGWRPSPKLEADVETDLKSYPVRIVTFYQCSNGSITYKYDKLNSSRRTSDQVIWGVMVACCEILAQCCGILAQCFRDIWGWCRDRYFVWALCGHLVQKRHKYKLVSIAIFNFQEI